MLPALAKIQIFPCRGRMPEKLFIFVLMRHTGEANASVNRRCHFADFADYLHVYSTLSTHGIVSPSCANLEVFNSFRHFMTACTFGSILQVPLASN